METFLKPFIALILSHQFAVFMEVFDLFARSFRRDYRMSY